VRNNQQATGVPATAGDGRRATFRNQFVPKPMGFSRTI
jgi:hypothetical protein